MSLEPYKMWPRGIRITLKGLLMSKGGLRILFEGLSLLQAL